MKILSESFIILPAESIALNREIIVGITLQLSEF